MKLYFKIAVLLARIDEVKLQDFCIDMALLDGIAWGIWFVFAAMKQINH